MGGEGREGLACREGDERRSRLTSRHTCGNRHVRANARRRSESVGLRRRAAEVPKYSRSKSAHCIIVQFTRERAEAV